MKYDLRYSFDLRCHGLARAAEAHELDGWIAATAWLEQCKCAARLEPRERWAHHAFIRWRPERGGEGRAGDLWPTAQHHLRVLC